MEYDSAAGVWSRWEQHLGGWAGGPVVSSLKVKINLITVLTDDHPLMYMFDIWRKKAFYCS